ncbi:MAG: anthranilate phosphoribosyltransferase [Armatimonadota bacterium]|nr:anthranilate phosphoribosyltransferase [Armatimonadota bacterium]
MTIEEALSHIVSRRSLREPQARELMEKIMAGDATSAQIAGLLVALRMKGETGAEITGFAQAMRAHVVPLTHSRKNVVDTCGTGGDTLKTFNLSTAAAIVTSAAGVPVAKHGNRAFTSKCGSADVLEALGVNLGRTPEENGRMLDEIGIAFMFAPNHHPAMKHAAGPRREMKLRTVFNVLGPLTNPAGADRQLIGVFAPALVPKIASALKRLGCKRGVVAHGMLGLDEVAPIGATRMAILDGKDVSERTMHAEEFGIVAPKLHEIACAGGVDEAVSRFRIAINDADSPECRAIMPSAGVAIWLGEGAASIREGVDLARSTVAAGKAEAKLREFVVWGSA